MAKDSKGHGSDERGGAKNRIEADLSPKEARAQERDFRRQEREMAAQDWKDRKKMAPLTRKQIFPDEKTTRSKGYHAEGGKVKSGTPSVDAEQKATYKAGRAAQAAENRKIMGPTTGKAAQNMRDLVRAKIADGKAAAKGKK